MSRHEYAFFRHISISNRISFYYMFSIIENEILFDGKGCLGVQKRLYDGMKKPLWGRCIPA